MRKPLLKTLFLSLLIAGISTTLMAQGGGNAMAFDGINDYVDLGITSTLKPESALTVSMWVYLDDWDVTAANQMVLFGNTQSGGQNLSVSWSTDYNIVASVYVDGDYRRALWTYGSGGLTAGWHHVAYTWNGTTLYLFVDGVQRASNSDASGNIVYNASNSTIIGAESGAGADNPTGQYFDGYIDELRIWDAALTQTAIQGYMHKPYESAAGSSLIGYYTMNSGTIIGSTLEDQSNAVGGDSNDEDGTIYEATTADYNTPIGNFPTGYKTNAEVLWSMQGTGSGDASGGVSAQVGTAFDADEFVAYAHNGGSGTSTADLPTDVDLRAGRIWNVDMNYDTETPSISFDLSAMGISSFEDDDLPASYYKLLIRAGTSGDFAVAANASSVSSGVVTFSNLTLLDGYYGTIGRDNGIPATVNTTTESNVGPTTATTGGNMTDDGYINATDRGVVYSSTDVTPDYGEEASTSDGTGEGVFVSSLTSLTPGTHYYVRAYADNSEGTSYGSVIEFYTEAATNASNIVSSDELTLVMDLSWIAGSGDGRAVFMRAGSSGMPTIADETTYTAAPTLGAGSEAGSGWYCVYNGTGTSVQVLGLTANTTYRVYVAEYTGSGSLINYDTDGGVNNPQNVATTNTVRWNGSSWYPEANDGSMDVEISGTYTVGTALETFNDLTVNNGASFVVPAGEQVTVDGDLISNGSFTLQSPTSLGVPGSLLTNGSVSGTMTFNRWIDQGSTEGSDYTWHQMTFPTGDQNAGDLFLGDYLYSYIEATNGWENIVPSSTTLTRGTGYIVKTVNGDRTVPMTGTFNTGTYSFDLDNTGADADHGYNLIGNPYPSFIDLEAIGRTNIGATFWVWDAANTNYATYVIGGGGSMSRYVHPGQAFFVKVNTGSASGTVQFDNADRTHTSGGNFYKGGLAFPEMNLKVSQGDRYDEFFFYNTDRTNDSYKLFSMDVNMPQLYAVKEDLNYVIYNQPGDLEGFSINLGFRSEESATYVIEPQEFEYDNYDVILEDLATGEKTLLDATSVYSFTHDGTAPEVRFKLSFAGKGTTSAELLENKEPVLIVPYADGLQVRLLTGEKAQVEIFDIQGKLMYREEMRTNEQRFMLEHSGIYLIRVKTADRLIVKKKALIMNR